MLLSIYSPHYSASSVNVFH